MVLVGMYNITCDYGMWHSLVARLVRDEEAVGSNPAAPTIKFCAISREMSNEKSRIFHFFASEK